MSGSSEVLKTTPLHAEHLRLGARMVDFGGWEMPIQYSGILAEHHAVRQRVGVFDVSHMGEIEVRGPQALDLVNYVTSNDAAQLAVGQAQYSGLLNDRGGFVDDLLVHKVSGDHYFLCVNAANQDEDFSHIVAQTGSRFDAVAEMAGARYAQIAVQGPDAVATLQKLCPVDLSAIRYYHFVDHEVSGAKARIARTGYTGEDGFEIYIDPAEAVRLWREILEAGADFGIEPCGLGARNTLRLEAAMPLHGHEIDAETTPWEAGLGWIVKLEKGDFVGRDALVAQKGLVARTLIGFEMQGRGIARDGYEVWVGEEKAGKVTSGGPSPTLGKNIGMCYLPREHARAGQRIDVVVRGQNVPAVAVPTPFYRRAK